jgi:hypothetical protein
MLLKIDNYLLGINNKLLFVIALFCIAILITLPLNLFLEFFNYKLESPHLKEENSLLQFFTIVIFVPILETLIFQLGIIKLVLYFIGNKKVAAFISASLFALSHPYGVFYILYTFIIGLYFVYIYFLSKRRNTNPFLTISAVHALFNLTFYLINFYIIN